MCHLVFFTYITLLTPYQGEYGLRDANIHQFAIGVDNA